MACFSLWLVVPECARAWAGILHGQKAAQLIYTGAGLGLNKSGSPRSSALWNTKIKKKQATQSPPGPFGVLYGDLLKFNVSLNVGICVYWPMPVS